MGHVQRAQELHDWIAKEIDVMREQEKILEDTIEARRNELASIAAKLQLYSETQEKLAHIIDGTTPDAHSL